MSYLDKLAKIEALLQRASSEGELYRHHFFGHKFALFGRSGPIDRTLFISSSRGTFLATRSKDEKIPDTGTVRLARRK